MNNDAPTPKPELAEEKQASKLAPVFRWIALVFAVGLTITIILLSDNIQAYMEQIPALGWLAYPAIFGISIAANATVLIPIPGVALTTAFGSVFNPFAVSLAAGLGAALGELSGYLAGYSGQGIIERTKWHTRFENWMKKNGNWTVLILAFIPNPLFDAAGMIAGALKMPVARFLLWCAIGKILKMLLFALAGSWFSGLF